MYPTDEPAILASRFPATLDGLAQLLVQFDQLSPGLRWGDRLAYSARLTIEELVINVVNHSGQSAENGWVAVSVAEMPDSVFVVVEDPGLPFDPTRVATPDTTSALGEREPGGLGIMMVQRLSDALRYERAHGINRTTAVLLRKISDG